MSQLMCYSPHNTIIMFYVILTEFGYKTYQPETPDQIAECEKYQRFKSASQEECEKWIEEAYIGLDESLNEDWNS